MICGIRKASESHAGESFDNQAARLLRVKGRPEDSALAGPNLSVAKHPTPLDRRRTTDRKDGRAVMSLIEKPDLAQQDSRCPLAWGVDEIAKVIGRTARQTHHILTKGQIKSARKVGGKWVANREALIRELSGGS